MNGDLIRRSALLEEMRKFVGNQRCLISEEVWNMVEDAPTAHDVDKVLEQLEERTEIAYNRYMDCNPNTPASVYARYGTQYNERKACLEIVKSGLKQ